jgi:photosystem II stability/assembly factor-like uncharacterized protein
MKSYSEIFADKSVRAARADLLRFDRLDHHIFAHLAAILETDDAGDLSK